MRSENLTINAAAGRAGASEKIDIRAAAGITGAYVAYMMGSGFSTGQEIFNTSPATAWRGFSAYSFAWGF